jgi:hypothetical protein
MATATAGVRKKRGPKPKPQGNRVACVSLRARQVYKDWLARFAGAEGTTPSKLLDLALSELAAAKGFEAPPKR